MRWDDFVSSKPDDVAAKKLNVYVWRGSLNDNVHGDYHPTTGKVVIRDRKCVWIFEKRTPADFFRLLLECSEGKHLRFAGVQRNDRT